MPVRWAYALRIFFVGRVLSELNKPRPNRGGREERSMNRKAAINRLAKLIEENAQKDAVLITCTYEPDAQPEDAAQAERDVRMFVRRLEKRWMRERLCTEAFRYVYAALPCGRTAWAAHMVLMSLPEELREEVEDIWGNGYCNVEKLASPLNTKHLVSWIFYGNEIKYKTNIREKPGDQPEGRHRELLDALDAARKALQEAADALKNVETEALLEGEPPDIRMEDIGMGAVIPAAIPLEKIAGAAVTGDRICATGVYAEKLNHGRQES